MAQPNPISLSKDEGLPPAAEYARRMRESMLWGGEVQPLPIQEEEEEDLEQDTLVPVVELKPTPRETIPSSAFKDPFDSLFSLIREHGRPEVAEIKIHGMQLKFKTLAIQLRLPLIALMVDADSLSMELDPDADLSLKIKHREYNARFAVSMSFSGNVNIMFFVAEEANKPKTE